MMFASCSSENDVLSGMGNTNVPTENGVLATVSCNIKGITTKVMADVENDYVVKDAILLLSKGGSILSAARMDNVLYTKNQTGLQIIAVANADEATYQALEKLTKVEDIEKQALAVADLKHLVKISKPVDVKFDNDKATQAHVDIKVEQVAARIDLSKLSVNIKAADSESVLLESVELYNQNTVGILNGNPTSQSGAYTRETITINQSINNGSSISDVCHFYSFANNNDENKTTIRLNLVIDGKAQPREFTIKHDKIEKVVAGYNYQLNISLIVKGENVEPEVTFTVAAWETSHLSGDLTETL